MGVTDIMAAPRKKWPKLSVIIPASNEEASIGGTLASFINQVYAGKPPEVLTVLANCRDKTGAVAGAFACRAIQGPADASNAKCKNLGAHSAAGDILIFADADVILPPESLQRIAERLMEKPQAVLSLPGKPRAGGMIVKACYWYANHFARKHHIQAPGRVIALTKNLFNQLGGFDEELQQGCETELLLRAQKADSEIIHDYENPASVSTRRFIKRGALTELRSWLVLQKSLLAGRRDIAAKPYELIR